LDFSKKDDIKKKDRLVALVDKMLMLKAEDNSSPTQSREIKQIDAKIDGFVCDLYNLTEEEIMWLDMER
jgi:hypothetical protein